MKRLLLTFGMVMLLAGCGSSKSDADGAGSQGDDGGADAATPAGSSLDDAAGCYLVFQGTSGVAIKATLLVPSGPTDGEIFVDSTGNIACVGASCSGTAGYTNATQIACTSAVVSAGFVNAHDHTTYDFTPPYDHGTQRWQHRNEWRTGADGMPELPDSPSTTDANILASIELRFLMSGVTSVVGSGGSPGLVRNLAEYNNTPWLEGLTGTPVYFDTFPLGDSNGTILTSGCGYPSIIKPNSAFVGGGIFAPHFAEGINPGAENEMICADSASIGLVTAQTTILHAVGTNAKDVAAIAAAKAHVVWAPRSNISLYGNTMPITEMKYAGISISLGTDWLPTGSMNMLREFACATEMNGKYFDNAFQDSDIVAMATSNAAEANGFGTQIGTLATGMAGDLVVFATSGAKDWSVPLQAASEDVALVLRGGQAMYGDALLVQAVAGNACDSLDVCGINKAVCLDVPGVTLADITNAASTTYPLFFCRGQTPTNEPTCIPYRDTYPDGSSATDQDGDGVPDTSDDCPAIFNPARSMDNNVQSDLDGDGFGDACDAQPLNASAH